MGCPPFDLLAFSEDQDRLQSLLEKENGVHEESDNFGLRLIVFVLWFKTLANSTLVILVDFTHYFSNLTFFFVLKWRCSYKRQFLNIFFLLEQITYLWIQHEFWMGPHMCHNIVDFESEKKRSQQLNVRTDNLFILPRQAKDVLPFYQKFYSFSRIQTIFPFF